MKSGGTRGVLAGWTAFLVLVALAALTPLRVPVLQFAGRDAAVIRQDARAAVTAEEHEAVAGRRAEWYRLHGHLSPFGLMAWAQDLWPWLLGLGLALPLLGGLVGAQMATASSRPAKTKTNTSTKAKTAPPPVPAAVPIAGEPPVPPREAELAAPVSPEPKPRREPAPAPSAAESPPEQRLPEPPPPLSSLRPPDPAAWDWRVRPVSRSASARPRPPAVESPNTREKGMSNEQ